MSQQTLAQLQKQNQTQLKESQDNNQQITQSEQSLISQNKIDQFPVIIIQPPEDENQFLVDQKHFNSKTESKQRGTLINKPNKHKFIFERKGEDVIEYQNCLIHKKPLDILCLIQKTMICSSCALFGDHKGHEFKNNEEIQKDIVKRQQLILNIFDQKQSIQKNKFGILELGQTRKLFRKNKQRIIEKLEVEVNRVVEQIKLCQKQCIQKADREFEKLETDYEISHKKLKDIEGLYSQWQQKALIYVQDLLGSKTISEQVKFFTDYKGEPQILKNGKVILSNIQTIVRQVQKQRNDSLNDLEITFDINLIEKSKKFARVQTATERQLHNINIQSYNANISLSSIENILDEPLITETNMPNIRTETSLLSLETSMRSNRKSPLYRSSMMLSPRREKNLRQQMNSLNKRRCKSPVSRYETPIQIARYRRIKLKLNQKYDKIMEEVIADTTEIYDLTNGELGNQIMSQMLDLLKTNNKVRTLKLGKNKLTDDMIPSLWKNLKNIQTLNLSNNSFTQKIIQSFMSNLPQIPSLKNLVLTQNKIVPRSLKAKVEQLRQIGILVTL